jgi:uncharacterized protein (TIGR03437 family)
MIRLFVLVALSLSGGLSYAAIVAQQILQVPSDLQQTLYSLTTDRSGNLIATGFNAKGGFIVKLDLSGKQVFSFSNFGAFPNGATADANGDIYWIGASGAPTFPFPFTNSVLGSPPSDSVSGFVVKFRGGDGSIVWATALGAVVPSTIAVDASGEVTVAGVADSATGITTPGAYAFAAVTSAKPLEIVRLSAAGDLIFAATYGGNNVSGSRTTPCQRNLIFAIDVSCPATEVAAVLLDSKNHIWIAGSTNTTDIPITTGALAKTCVCGNYSLDGYLAELSADGSSLLYSTYIPSENRLGADAGTTITSAAIDGGGHIWFAGSTPDSGTVASGVSVEAGGLLAEYDPVGNQIAVEKTVIGGPATLITKIAVGPKGAVAFAGGPVFSRISGPSTANGFAGTFSGSGPIQLASLPQNAIGTGLAFMPSGAFAVSGAASVATVLVASDGPSATPNVLVVANGAIPTAATGQLSPGEIITIFGTGLGPAIPVLGGTSGLTAYGTQLAGVQVLIGGVAAPILYVSANQINAIVPFGSNTLDSAKLIVTNGGVPSEPALLGIVPATPGVFTTQDQDAGFPVAAALNQDGTINSTTNPASPGSVVSIFATGLGTLLPEPPDGVLIPALALPALAQQILIGGSQFLSVLYAGPAPGEVAGVMQINFRLPATQPPTPAIDVAVANRFSQYFSVWVNWNWPFLY